MHPIIKFTEGGSERVSLVRMWDRWGTVKCKKGF
jgi:hypothetical protein